MKKTKFDTFVDNFSSKVEEGYFRVFDEYDSTQNFADIISNDLSVLETLYDDEVNNEDITDYLCSLIDDFSNDAIYMKNPVLSCFVLRYIEKIDIDAIVLDIDTIFSEL